MIKIVENSPQLIQINATDSVDFEMPHVCFLAKGSVDGFHFKMDKIQALFPDSELNRYKGRLETAKESILSRLILFDFLSKHCHVNTKLLKINYSDSGKPYFENRNIHFSIAHSGQMVFVAISFYRAIGIDFEFETPKKDFNILAKRFFHLEEYNFLNACKEEDLAIAFLKMWIKKEAIVKCLGETMFSMMSKINTLDNFIYSPDNQNIDLIYISLINAKKTDVNISLASIDCLQKVYFLDYNDFEKR